MDLEGCSDIFCRAFFNSDVDMQTDTHWRCSNGEGSFNYRLILPLKSDEKNFKLQIEAWDKDVVAKDDLIGSCSFDLEPMFKDCQLTGRQMYLTKSYFESYLQAQLVNNGDHTAHEVEWEDEDRFWLPIRRYISEQDMYVSAGEILVSVNLLPKDLALKNP
jgi:hypothetical protein